MAIFTENKAYLQSVQPSQLPLITVALSNSATPRAAKGKSMSLMSLLAGDMARASLGSLSNELRCWEEGFRGSLKVKSREGEEDFGRGTDFLCLSVASQLR